MTAPAPEVAAANAGRLRAFRQTKLYDLITAVPLIVWYGLCVWRLWPLALAQLRLVQLFLATDPSVLPPTLLLSLISKLALLALFAALVVLFAVRVVPRPGRVGLFPRFAALAGTFLSVGLAFLPLHELSSPAYLVSLALMIGGFGFAIWALLSLGRSISIVPQARRLVTRGPYRLIRHPLYLGEMVGTAGVALQFEAPWAWIIFGLQCAFQLWRIRYEERLLGEVFPTYTAYAARTARLLPGIY